MSVAHRKLTSLAKPERKYAADMAIRATNDHDVRGVNHERQRVRAMIERAGVAMLMNVDEQGRQVGRPMAPLLTFLTPQTLEGMAQIAATEYEPDPWPRTHRGLVPCRTLVTGDQKHLNVRNIEQPGVEVQTATLRYDDLRRVTRQTER